MTNFTDKMRLGKYLIFKEHLFVRHNFLDATIYRELVRIQGFFFSLEKSELVLGS